jgi:beta-galactosidase
MASLRSCLPVFGRLLAVGAVFFPTFSAPRVSAAAVTIDATSPPKAPQPLTFAVGGKSPVGHVLSANTRYLTLDEQPWFPIMGEFHYSRYPAAEWETELLKMKAGGINVVATYVFWIHHEEIEGKFDWSGQRDLRRFISLCAKHGLYAWVRIGPWDHGEARNGGFPDWLVPRERLRSNDPAYLASVKNLYGEIGRQLKGLFWPEGGPIVGVQVENEYYPGRGGVEHMQTLLALAHQAGIDAPFYTATGWDNAAVPPTEFLPVFGGYTEQFWSGSLEALPPNQNFFFTAIRAEDNVMGDLTPKNPGYNSKYDDFPFLTAEMGGGMAIAYHRRPIMHADDSTAAALVKLGAGITGLGYYMYHGGTNPDGLTALQETQSGWNGYNDMEAKSYDFQAPLGEFGQFNASYRTLRLLHLFLGDFGGQLAPMAAYFPAQMPKNRDDVSTPRVAARVDDTGRRGFIFINNYQRNHPLGDKTDFQVSLKLPAGVLQIPRQPTVIPEGTYTHWPVNLDVGGVTLRYATAELVCRIDDPATLVFSAWPGLNAEFAFAPAGGDTVNAPRGRVIRDGGIVYVGGLEPGTDAAIEVTHAGGKRTQILLLARQQALQLAKAHLAGRERLVLSPGDVYFTADEIHLSARDPAQLRVAVLPALRRAGKGFRETERDGVFQGYAATAKFVAMPDVLELKPTQAAAPSVPAKINPNPRRKIAREPEDADFERAAEWRIHVPPRALDAVKRTLLQISYEGDVARLYSGARFDNDNFYKGTPWEIALWRFTPEEIARGLDLKILPLRQDTPVFLARGARPEFPDGAEALRLKDVKLVREYEAVLDAGR